VVLVVTSDADTARWAAKTVDLGAGLAWRAFVIGPEGIPVITDVDVALREPHLAVLSVMAHGRDDDVPTAVRVATAAAVGAAGLPEPLKMLCFALIESSLGEAARKSFEMLPQGQQFFSETQRRSFAQGKAEGQAEGKAEGRAEGEARSILRVLERRGLAVSAEQHERILGCPELATLEGWLDKAVTAVTIEELFAVEPGNPSGVADRRNRR
jgi:hypothetical protein